ncbi:hypothetical protein EHQ23_03690 [Leptospira bourretii]|uniref:Uncharacterized protein n=1 Tax=Leptospira bourretii TaxID=2484962 RepID=A0A4V3JKV1_9LEPT|nr:hypothetical protein [Leptospira bourretii]TGK87961.1 hypothetical protein EHQ23_03690 [Leptospira bourretii]TGK88613.1 hypothetical protein EHQ26_16215 [Leptospira bourretii]TGL20552.1 hypothetical protein EHQ47_13485 [Leptospira bourretii]TGL36267.1 hypothetical protein EHQ45_07085 [Leptospira bourretii]
MNQADEETLNNLIKGGLLGAGLTALLKQEADGEDIAVGALLGAAILASIKASERAKETKIPILVQEGDSLYWKHPDGHKEFFKKLPTDSNHLPPKFKLS